MTAMRCLIPLQASLLHAQLQHGREALTCIGRIGRLQPDLNQHVPISNPAGSMDYWAGCLPVRCICLSWYMSERQAACNKCIGRENQLRMSMSCYLCEGVYACIQDPAAVGSADHHFAECHGYGMADNVTQMHADLLTAGHPHQSRCMRDQSLHCM